MFSLRLIIDPLQVKQSTKALGHELGHKLAWDSNRMTWLWRFVSVAVVASAIAVPPAPHANTAKSRWPSFSDAVESGEPMGAGWGYGCSTICDDNFKDIKDKFDDFAV